jgi:LmbE family N-acetylglucosaminyl deacetylase
MQRHSTIFGLRDGAGVLAVGAHPDDIELGMGATLARLTQQGNLNVQCLILSKCDETLPRSFPAGTLEEECKKSLQILGVENQKIQFQNFPVRRFTEFRQEILQHLINLKMEMELDVVFVPSTRDIHQDHSVVSQEAVRSFKNKTLLGYELSWNVLSSQRGLYVEIDDDSADKKMSALSSYKSQKSRPYMNNQTQFSLLRTHGLDIGKEYAETFEVIRLVQN